MGTRKNGAREGDTPDAESNTNKDLVGARGVATLMLLRIPGGGGGMSNITEIIGAIA